jgi:hypothetical protein
MYTNRMYRSVRLSLLGSWLTRLDFRRLLLYISCLVFAFMCSPLIQTRVSAQSQPTPSEQPVTLLPIDGPLALRSGQFSGMAWYGDTLVILPQYPARFEHNLLALPKRAILDALRGVNPAPLSAFFIPLYGYEGLVELEGFEGFEAIAIAGERIYLTIETRLNRRMMGYLATGVLLPDLSSIRLYPTVRSTIAPQMPILNLTDEALIVDGDRIITFYEANGMLVNPFNAAHVFDADDLQSLGTLPLDYLDYRVTDASPPDEQNRFWVINTFFPGQLINLGPDPVSMRYGIGPTHQQYRVVERLVQMVLTPTGIELVPGPPLQLQLTEPKGRNWEGIVRLESDEISGFLLITDNRPTTLLGFVADP